MSTAAALRTEIANCRIEADRLMNIASDATVKAQIRRAVSDLNEAELWLNDKTASDRPATIGIANFTIGLAVNRLAAIDNFLQRYGPDMVIIG